MDQKFPGWKIFSEAISKRHFELNDDVYADYVENLLNDINKEPNPASNFAFGDDSKYEWWKWKYEGLERCWWRMSVTIDRLYWWQVWDYVAVTFSWKDKRWRFMLESSDWSWKTGTEKIITKWFWSFKLHKNLPTPNDPFQL